LEEQKEKRVRAKKGKRKCFPLICNMLRSREGKRREKNIFDISFV